MLAMSNDNHDYRPRSPDLSTPFVPPPNLGRLPSYSRTPSESPYAFSPRASIDTSASFNPQTNAASYFTQQNQVQSPATFGRTPSIPNYPNYQANFSPYQANAQPPPPPPTFQSPTYTQTNYYDPTDPDMARTRAQRSAEQHHHQPPPHQQHYDPVHDTQTQLPPIPPPTQYVKQEPTTDPAIHLDIKTKFPVARIKRIMQADEDIGKVAQATPTAAAKALELFLASLVIKSATEARQANSKRITINHLKNVIAADKNFDFLNDLCEQAPDEEKAGGGAGKGKRGKSEEDSEEEMTAGMTKGKVKKRRGSESED